MNFSNPWYAIFGILGAIAWAISYWGIAKKAQIYLPTNLVLKNKKIQRATFFLAGIIAWALIAFSLMGPRDPIGYDKSEIEVNDIIFIVDVSKSMLADDFRPNRLEVAKQKIIDFVNLRPKDRIGIVIFSEQAFTLLPLSTDLDLVKRMVKEIKVGFLGSGTNIGDALALGVARAVQSKAKSKIAILLTDGVSNVGTMTPLQAAEVAKEKNIKVYTIAIGGEEDARIPGGPGNSYFLIPGGSFDTKTLKEVSSITGGKSYVTQDENALKQVLYEINQLERTKIKNKAQIVYKELYHKYFLIGFFLLLFVELSRRIIIKEAV